MKTLFEFLDYKKFVLAWIQERPKKGRGEFQKIAKALSVHPTLISHIFKADKNLSLEQTSTLCRYLQLSNIECDYFLLLVQRAKSGTAELDGMLDRQIQQMRKSARSLANRVDRAAEITSEDQATFYSNWYCSGVRLLTSIPRYQTLEAIEQYFGLPRALIKEVLEFLTRTGLCGLQDGHYSLGPALTHLEAGSQHISRHHTNWRLKCIEMHPRITDEDLVFTGPLTISARDAAKVREKLVKLVQEMGAIARGSSAEELRCFGIDWVRIGGASHAGNNLK